MKVYKKRILIAFTFLLFFLTLTACNPENKSPVDGGTTPIYQGMTISESMKKLGLQTRKNSSTLKRMSINQSSNSEFTIEETIRDEFEFENNEELDYYASLNSDLFITVKLLNPDGQAILRFTLNGTVYQSFQFQEGSDSENLILKVNSGTAVGITEYTIDEIKYVENKTNNIKDVIFEGDRTIKLGVTYNIIPTAEVTNEVINATSFTFDINVIDNQKLISNS